MIDDVRAAFAALYSAETSTELSVAPVHNTAGICAAVDSSRRAHILFAVAEDASAEHLPDVAALAATVRALTIDGRTGQYLDVVCLFASVSDVFEHFCAAVIDEMTREADAYAALSAVLTRWREFLTPAGSPVSAHKIAPILGELLMLFDIVSKDPERRLDSWMGPTKARHDFRRAALAVEVKTTMSHTSSRVTIHGLDQLDAPDHGELYLHMVRLEAVPQGKITLAELVDRLLSVGVRASDMYKALALLGVPPASLSDTRAIAFDVRERTTYPVDERVPRLTGASLVAGRPPDGVDDISYAIDLALVSDLRLTQDEYATVTDRLAGASPS